METLIQKYFEFLSLPNQESLISLGEGNTPLVKLNNIMGLFDNQYTIYAKVEGHNPTGSFKDRGMTVAVSHACQTGAKGVLCASTGNTSASAAAYAAKAGLKAFVIIPAGKIAQGKLVQAIMYGADIIQIDGNFDHAMDIVKTVVNQLSHDLPIAVVNSINPYRLAGQQTASFEIIEALGQAPDYHAIPVGNAGNISAYFMGYRAYFDLQKSAQIPKMLGYQAAGAAPLVHQAPVEKPETIATAIRIGKPQSWDLANEAVNTTQGWFKAISDQALLKAQRMLSSMEGIFCEPASAISVAGLCDDIRAGKIKTGSTIVCTLTGNGLKDPDIVLSHHADNACQRLPADQAVIFKYLEQKLRN